jgi:hypothetical protein
MRVDDVANPTSARPDREGVRGVVHRYGQRFRKSDGARGSVREGRAGGSDGGARAVHGDGVQPAPGHGAGRVPGAHTRPLFSST